METYAKMIKELKSAEKINQSRKIERDNNKALQSYKRKMRALSRATTSEKMIFSNGGSKCVKIYDNVVFEGTKGGLIKELNRNAQKTTAIYYDVKNVYGDMFRVSARATTLCFKVGQIKNNVYKVAEFIRINI